MANLAAVILAPNASLEVQEVGTFEPGPHEFLIKNELISFVPADYKVARGMWPIPYPSILGYSFGGTIQTVGSQVTDVKVGDRVAAIVHQFATAGNQYRGFQKYVIVPEDYASKVPDGMDLAIPTTLIGNLSTIVGLFNGRAGLDRPSLDGPSPANGQKILVYGGSSSCGSLSVQYLAQAGYSVVTTTSPRNKDFVSKLGAVKVLDHTQEQNALLKSLVAEGPYKLVVDCISLPNTVAVTAAVVAAQGGDKLYAVLGSTDPTTLPEGVTQEFQSWPSVLDEEENAGMLSWALKTYFPQAVTRGLFLPLPITKVNGGLKGVNDALDRLEQGVSGVKLVLDPWE